MGSFRHVDVITGTANTGRWKDGLLEVDAEYVSKIYICLPGRAGLGEWGLHTGGNPM
jgi:hypothetical protein